MSNYVNNTKAREYAFKFIFNTLTGSNSADLKGLITSKMPSAEYEAVLSEFNNTYLEADLEHPDNQLTLEAKNIALDLLEKTLSHEAELAQAINSVLKNNNYKSLEKVEQSLLLLGAFELKYNVKTPAPIVISEYISLASKFGKEDTYSLINGVLDKMSKQDASR